MLDKYIVKTAFLENECMQFTKKGIITFKKI